MCILESWWCVDVYILNWKLNQPLCEVYLFMGKKSPCSVNGFEQLGGQRGGWSGEAILVKVRMKKKTCHHIFSEQFSFVNMTKSQELVQNPWFQMNGRSKCASGCGQWGRSEWVKVKTVLHLPHTPPSPPTHFRYSTYLQLYLSQQDLTLAAGTNAASRVFCGKWNLACKFPGKPTGPGVWWNQTKPAILPSYRGQSGRMGGLIQPFEKQWGIL